MKHLKTFNKFNESIFDVFKRKDTEDDKIALTYISRLLKVKDVNPYKIRVVVDLTNEVGSAHSYKIDFDDTTVYIGRAKFNSPPRRLDPSIEDSDMIQYKFLVDCMGKKEKVKCRKSYKKKLFELTDKIYKETSERERLDRINTEINPAADRL